MQSRKPWYYTNRRSLIFSIMQLIGIKRTYLPCFDHTDETWTYVHSKLTNTQNIDFTLWYRCNNDYGRTFRWHNATFCIFFFFPRLALREVWKTNQGKNQTRLKRSRVVAVIQRRPSCAAHRQSTYRRGVTDPNANGGYSFFRKPHFSFFYFLWSRNYGYTLSWKRHLPARGWRPYFQRTNYNARCRSGFLNESSED